MFELEFSNEVWYWRGPAPYYFVSVPDERCDVVRAAAEEVSYGWGMIPAVVTVGATAYYTALWPKDGGFVVPVKTAVRRAEGIDEGDVIALHLRMDRRDQLTARSPMVRPTHLLE